MEDKIVFDGSEGRWITAAQASKKQEVHLKKQREMGDSDPIRAQFFGKQMLQKMLDTKGAMGIRIYLGKEEDGQPNLVLVPTDQYGHDIVYDKKGLKDMPEDEADHGSDGPRCPNYCT
ncbi:hypothetical protein LAG90_09860 [Marinilongibacter aquaticus]|uniref:hypothetical protein n=1 Tax=Marinilongibacter aquaticus TaxID=2975157 RepID=UPI0021BDC7E0|nr:hypothetical protein [Marinilongibacter aquaticus]UBM60938.1 hypothetical protein LAG90_09860 [Marinilongibacter aquaticus]